MSGKRVAQPMDATLPGNPGLALGVVVDLLHCTGFDGVLPIASRKQPTLRWTGEPIAPKLHKQPLREQGITVLGPLALLHPQRHPLATIAVTLRCATSLTRSPAL